MSDSQESVTLGQHSPAGWPSVKDTSDPVWLATNRSVRQWRVGGEISHTDFPQNQNWNEVVLRKTDLKDVIGNPGFCNLKILSAFHWLHMEFRLLVY